MEIKRMGKSNSILIVLLIICSTLRAYSQQDVRLPKPEQIHQLVRYYVDDRGFNGNILIAENGKIIYENSEGWADVSKEIPLTLNTPFYLASVSKQFTATAILMLRDDGLLDLDDMLIEFFPEIGDFAARISIRNLLNHTSGLPDYFQKQWDEPGLTNAQLYEKIINNEVQLNFKPGHKHKYNNTGYVLLSLIVEMVSDMPFYKFIETRITEPLDMENTWVFDIRNNRRNVATRAKGYGPKMRKEDDYYLLTTGDGGMYSTIEDLFEWDRALYTEKLISRESLEEAFTPVTLANGSVENYGFGWLIGSNLNGKTVYHSGGLAGFRAYIERQIEVENTIIILNNNSFDDIDEMRNILVKILDGRPYKFPEN